MEASHAKKSLRRAVLARLKARNSAQRAADSAALRALLYPIMDEMEQRLTRPLRVALYAALPHEVDLMPLLRERPQHGYAFPRCLPGRQLAFHAVSEPERELEVAAMGILTPRAELPLMSPETMDLLIVPGVAFSRAGERLGYGGGYYDSFIPRCANARVLALAFAEQVVEQIPTEAHDLRLPQVVSLAPSLPSA